MGRACCGQACPGHVWRVSREWPTTRCLLLSRHLGLVAMQDWRSTWLLFFPIDCSIFFFFLNVSNKSNKFELDISRIDSHAGFFFSRFECSTFGGCMNSASLCTGLCPGGRGGGWPWLVLTSWRVRPVCPGLDLWTCPVPWHGSRWCVPFSEVRVLGKSVSSAHQTHTSQLANV